MMTSRASRARERRGIVLVLVLAMLGLLALVGSHVRHLCRPVEDQQRIFMQSLFQPQADELIDFGLAQLITDTNDIRSAIRGHSLARDMYGNDATGNAMLSYSPTTGQSFPITGVHGVGNANQYILTTNIAQNDSSFLWIQLHALDHEGRLHRPPSGSANWHGDDQPEFRDHGRQRLQPGSNAARTSWSYINPIDAGNR